MEQVTGLDPRAANDARVSVATAPDDGYFLPAQFRGAFSKDVNWLLNWTATYAYGYHAGQTNPAPDSSIELKGTVLSFLTVPGSTYLVEESSDGVTYTKLALVAVDGSIKQVADLSGYNPTNLYRVSVV
jgi:hypothetical protein